MAVGWRRRAFSFLFCPGFLPCWRRGRTFCFPQTSGRILFFLRRGEGVLGGVRFSSFFPPYFSLCRGSLTSGPSLIGDTRGLRPSYCLDVLAFALSAGSTPDSFLPPFSRGETTESASALASQLFQSLHRCCFRVADQRVLPSLQITCNRTPRPPYCLRSRLSVIMYSKKVKREKLISFPPSPPVPTIPHGPFLTPAQLQPNGYPSNPPRPPFHVRAGPFFLFPVCRAE